MFTVYCRSRQRTELLIECCESFFTKASKPDELEFLVGTDYDDKSVHDFEDYANSVSWNIAVLRVKRSDFMHRDYDNRLAAMAQGDYIWGINDECEVENYGWDTEITTRIEDYLKDKPDRLCYVMINDGSHIVDENNQNAGRFDQKDYGNCFPLLTKECVQTQGFFIHPLINFWGGDSSLYHLYRDMKNNRVLWAQDIKLIHKSGHTGLRDWDYGLDRGRQISKCTGLPTALHWNIVNKLDNRVIECSQ